MFAVHFLLFFFLCLVLVLEEEDDCGVSSSFVLVQSLRRNYVDWRFPVPLDVLPGIF